jgi:hypothetical protein
VNKKVYYSVYKKYLPHNYPQVHVYNSVERNRKKGITMKKNVSYNYAHRQSCMTVVYLYYMKYTIAVCICAIALLLPKGLSAQLVGGAYEIYADTFSFVSGNGSTGGIYDLYDTGGEFFAAASAGGDYVLRGGYRAAEKGILRVDVSDTSIDYGILTPGVVVTSSITVAVWTDAVTGYTLSLRENQDPTTVASDTITDVNIGDTVDGTTEAYGIAATGADVIVTGDISLSTTPQNIATAVGDVTNRITEIIYKVSIDANTPDGIYSHVVFPTILVNP